MGGIQPGGLNFDCKVRRESTEVSDMFIAHIGVCKVFSTVFRSHMYVRVHATDYIFSDMGSPRIGYVQLSQICVLSYFCLHIHYKVRRKSTQVSDIYSSLMYSCVWYT